MFFSSLDGPRNTSLKLCGLSSGVGRKTLLSAARSCLPTSQGGFGVINFEQKAQALALQWIKRYFDPEQSKLKNFFTFFVSSGLQFDPRNALACYFIARRLAALPPHYRLIFRAWQSLVGRW